MSTDSGCDSVSKSVSKEGCMLVELFSVDFKSERACNLYGTIKVDTPSGSQFFIYQKERENSESIKPGKTALWSGLPDHPIIRKSQNFSFEVELKNRNETTDSSSDEVICKGLINWDFKSQDSEFYNKHLVDRLKGKTCSVEVSYAAYSNAVTGQVWTILHGYNLQYIKRKFPTKVQGRIVARNSFIPTASKELFHKEGEDSIDVRDWHGTSDLQERAAVCRSVVAVPLSSTLKISFDLKEYSESWNWACPLADGIACLAVEAGGTSSEYIHGDAYDVEVKVFWRA